MGPFLAFGVGVDVFRGKTSVVMTEKIEEKDKKLG